MNRIILEWIDSGIVTVEVTHMYTGNVYTTLKLDDKWTQPEIERELNYYNSLPGYCLYMK
jgi:hypothetical protein